MDSEFTIECIRDYQSFQNLQKEWDSLLQRTDIENPFLTHGWQAAWLETYGIDNKLLLFIVRHAREIVGIIPFVQMKRYGFKVLELAGTGRSDWLDLIIMPIYRHNVLQKMLSYLVKNNKDWHIINFRDILNSSPTISDLELVCKGLPITVRRKVRTVSPYLRIDMIWDDYLKIKSQKFRSNLKYYNKKAKQSGNSFSIDRTGEISKVQLLLDNMEEVESKSWKATSGNPKLTTKMGKEFYRKFCAYFSENGCIEIWTAALDGQIIAFLLNIIYGNKCYHYNGAFDQNFQYLSPGLLLHAEAIKSAFNTDLNEYDFLSGDEPYKYKWCDNHRDIYQIVIFRNTFVSFTAFLILIKVRWILKKYDLLLNIKRKFGHWKYRFLK